MVHLHPAHPGSGFFQLPLEDIPYPVHPVQLFGTAFRIDDFRPQIQHFLPFSFNIFLQLCIRCFHVYRSLYKIFTTNPASTTEVMVTVTNPATSILGNR